MDYLKIKIVVTDLDGTLAPSKAAMDDEMSEIICELLSSKDMAVVGGGFYSQFQKQLIGSLKCPAEKLGRLYLFPTNATAFYRFGEQGWYKVYSEDLSEEQKKLVYSAFPKALELAGFKNPEKLYGSQLEDRGTQITFSALGQEAPLELKSAWDPNQQKRIAIKIQLDKLLNGFEIRLGGTTSIDITRAGIDKAYAIRKITEIFGYSKSEMIFIGDALYDGGNDYAVKLAGVESLATSGPEETKSILKSIIGINP
ncbi:HAD-IIB family hydrolase [Candidatus Marsarchaeota archaeon]|nr:HAD-IIB family hydrolase [Candidatus Marsarchaeota archaeon]